MALDEKTVAELRGICAEMRKTIIQTLHGVQTGHPGGSLSAVEILTTLYFRHMQVDCKDAQCADRDRFIASKGHCAPALYTTLCEKGFLDKAELANLRQLGCKLQGHPDMKKTPGVDLSTGSLGLGLSAGIGMALSARLNDQNYRTYVLLGDGELQEGQIWEAAMAAAKFKLDHLTAIVDNNGVQLDGTVEEIMSLGSLKQKFAAFGWHVIEADGHDLDSLDAAFIEAKSFQGAPSVILARTVKGKGVSFMEGKNEWHGKAINDQQFAQAMRDLEVAQ
ncbi:transketolase [Anaerosporomusa subterranea]|uniref:Transketolase n=1 Tax=Anaerosporomusa subterranea TaxID=1794912 RepID=A0A154BPW4_ANASB|nr:transketolase [Anaerosporomusa subterranea]KYZ75997.1 transketolase [Anaerosporomusa subterranea]